MGPLKARSEMRNILAGYMRLKRMTREKAQEVMDFAEKHLINSEIGVASSRVLELVGESKCSAHDCEYVALARQLSAVLVTKDKAIVKQFPETARDLKVFLEERRNS